MPGAQSNSPQIAIVGCSLVTLDARGVVPNQVVVVAGKHIRRVEDAAAFAPDNETYVIDGHGQFLMAGLMDMHVHVGLPLLEAGKFVVDHAALYDDAAAEMKLYLDYGVTTVRNMAGALFHRRLADEVEAGLRPGPRILSSSPILDGEKPVWPFGVPVVSRQAARQAVTSAARSGFGFIKVYNLLSRNAYGWLIEEARNVGIPVVGHVPFDIGVMDALAARQSSIEHLRGYDIRGDVDPRKQSWIERAKTWLYLSPADLERYQEATVAAGTWNCPTFCVMDSAIRAARDITMPTLCGIPTYLANRMETYRNGTCRNVDRSVMLAHSLEVQYSFALALHRANGRLLAGTDAGINDIIPGRSLHDELEAFVRMGMSPVEALRVCTRGAAEYLGMKSELGVIAEGALADLVLLAEDPTHNIRNARTVIGTMASGRWHHVSAAPDPEARGFPARA